MVISSPSNISVNGSIIVDFSTNIQPGSDFNSIAVTDAAGNAVAVNCTVSGNKLIITPESDLNSGESFMAVIPAGAVQDTSGGLLTSDYSFSFSTTLSPGAAELRGRVNVLP
jgi:hypothetical protein